MKRYLALVCACLIGTSLIVGSTSKKQNSGAMPSEPRSRTGAPGKYDRAIHPTWSFSPNHILVKLKEGTGQLSMRQKTETFQARHNLAGAAPAFRPRNQALADRSDIGLSRILKVSVPQGTDIRALIARLNGDPEVEYAEPDYIVPLRASTIIPNDPGYSDQQHLPQIKAPEGWEVSKGSRDIVVAMIDTGTDWNHPDLAANIWSNPGETINGVDSDGNGFVDDIRGWDFVRDVLTLTTTGVAEGEDGSVADNNPMDFNGHGTLTSGIVGAVTNNGMGVSGVGWNVSVMPLRIGWTTASGSGVGLTSFMANAFVYAADNGADAASLSFGSGNTVVDAARYAFENGVVVCVSAGNDGPDPVFAEFGGPLERAPFSIAAAAVDEFDRKAGYSSFGEWVTLTAPGGTAATPILSTFFDDGFASSSGTSFSSPIAAGVAALVKSLHPDWSATDVLLQVVETADNLDIQNPGFAGKLGSGRVNVFRALSETVAPQPILQFVGRSTSDPTGNDNQQMDAGETVDLNLSFRNLWADGNQLTAQLSTDHWAVTVTDGNAALEPIPGLTDLDNNVGSTTDPFTVTIHPDALPDNVHFTAQVSGDNGYSETFEFEMPISPAILFVDDDDGIFLDNATVNNIEHFYTEEFDRLGIAYDVHNHAINGTPSFELMRKYSTVVWACEWEFPALDATDRAELTKFLDNGGHLFMSGQDIGWDLSEDLPQDPLGNSVTNEFVRSGGASRVFYETYLHARYLQDDSIFSTLAGVDGDPISDGLNISVFQPGRSVANQYPSEVTALGSAVSIFDFPNGTSGAVRFAGVHRLVSFAFGGFEAITQDGVRAEILPRILNWLNGLSFSHTPLVDTEDEDNPRTVTASVSSTVSDVASVDLYWDTDGELPFQRIAMVELIAGTYFAEIPAQSGKEVQYVIVPRLENDYIAPSEIYAYKTATDVTPPTFADLTEAPNSLSNVGPFPISVLVGDNLAVDESSVALDFESTSGVAGSVSLLPDVVAQSALTDGSDTQKRYRGEISATFAFGDTVKYRARAADLAATPNSGSTDEQNFVIGYEDFERGLDYWQADADGWGLFDGTSSSGLFSVSQSPDAAYAPDLNTSLTLLLPLDLSDAMGADLSFQQFYSFAPGHEDFGVVEASGDGGTTWSQLGERTDGSQFSWQEKVVPLTAFAGAGFADVLIRFRTQTDSQPNTNPGWLVDDVRVTDIVVSVPEQPLAGNRPKEFTLHQNYPNPFNPSTKITFDLPKNANVTLRIFNITGGLVDTLVDGERTAGAHSVVWEPAAHLASGVYLARLDGDVSVEVKKLMFLK